MTQTVCWHASWSQCRDPHDDAAFIMFGRCRSGRRWFWAADEVCADPGPLRCCGRESTPDAAEDAARAAVIELAGDRPAVALLSHQQAAAILRDVNAEARRRRPPSGATAAAPVEHLYSVHEPYDEPGPPYLVAHRITRKTARRVYFITRDYGPGGVVGYVDRQALERDGELWHRPSLQHLYASREVAERLVQNCRPASVNLAQLRQEMADAHPDRGGSRDAFMTARERYLRAAKAS